jgi:hypothetical protein
MNKTLTIAQTLEIAAKTREHGIIPEFSFVLGGPDAPAADWALPISPMPGEAARVGRSDDGPDRRSPRHALAAATREGDRMTRRAGRRSSR